MAFMHVECFFMDITLRDPHLMVFEFEVQLGEKPSIAQFIKQLINNRNGKLIRSGHLVNSVTVDTYMLCVIFLLNQDDKAGECTLTRTNDPCFE